jgi:hypothetical protein
LTSLTRSPSPGHGWTTTSPKTPGFITSIAIDPQDSDQAWVSYSGYTATTPTTPGHVFKVVFSNGSSAWTNVSGSLADLPVNDLVRDDANGDLYAATDFGVLRKASGSTTWALAAPRHAER